MVYEHPIRLSSYTGGLPTIQSGGSPLAGASPGASISGQGTSIATSAVNQRRFDEDVTLPLIKVVVLGAPGVGKSSVVKVNVCVFLSRLISSLVSLDSTNVDLFMSSGLLCYLFPFLSTSRLVRASCGFPDLLPKSFSRFRSSFF